MPDDNAGHERSRSTTAREDHPPDEDTIEGDPRDAARRYADIARTNPATLEDEHAQLVALLSHENAAESLAETLARRQATAIALHALATEAPASLTSHLAILVDALETEHTRTPPAKPPRLQTTSQEITVTLIETIGHIIQAHPETIASIADLTPYTSAITQELDTETLQVTTKALFESTPYLQQPDAVVETLATLLEYPESTVQAWSAGALGKLAPDTPETVAPTATKLRPLLTHDDESVQHNALETLATLTTTHPEVVVPAAGTLRQLLNHDNPALKHNAAGVLGRLAETHPDAVHPAVDQLHTLCQHQDDQIRQIAMQALTQLAQTHPDTHPDR